MIENGASDSFHKSGILFGHPCFGVHTMWRLFLEAAEPPVLYSKRGSKPSSSSIMILVACTGAQGPQGPRGGRSVHLVIACGAAAGEADRRTAGSRPFFSHASRFGGRMATAALSNGEQSGRQFNHFGLVIALVGSDVPYISLRCFSFLSIALFVMA